MTNSKAMSEQKENTLNLLHIQADKLNRLTRLVEYYKKGTDKELTDSYKYIRRLSFLILSMSVPLSGFFILKVIEYV